MSDGGKGSTPRPFTDRKSFEENFDRTFGKPKDPKETQDTNTKDKDE